MTLKKLFLTCLIILGALSARAQVTLGSWKIYSPFNNVDFIAGTPDKVYYTSVGYLFSYDPETQETYAYTAQNKLSDTGISSITYNPEKKYLFIAYTNGNVDLLFDDGKVVNMCDIRDANLTFTKTVNNVSFDDGKIYAATDFGVVIFDDTRFVVLESGIYNRKVNSFLRKGDRYLLATGTQVFSLPVSSKINTFSKYQEVTLDNNVNEMLQLVSLDGDRLLTRTQWQRRVVTFNSTENSFSVLKYLPDGNLLNPFVQYKSGWFLNGGTTLQTVGPDGNDAITTTLPAELKNVPLGFWNSADNVYAGVSGGLCEYALGNNEATLISGPAKPGSITVSAIDDMKVADDGTIYFTRVANSRYTAVPDQVNIFTPINRLRDGEVLDINPDNLTFDSTNQSPAGNAPKKNQHLAIHPTNSDRIYVGNWSEGFMVFEGNDHIMTYNGTNSPIVDRHNGGSANAVTAEIAFDNQGNLWALECYKQDRHLMVVLPAAKVNSDKEPQVSDWQQVVIPKTVAEFDKDGRLYYAKKSGIFFASTSCFDEPMIVYNPNNTLTIADDTYKAYKSFTDQDSREFAPNRFICFAEDHNGKVWMGTDLGVVEFTNPRSLMDAPTIRHPKVSRNDGTNSADYLLDGVTILGIAVDHGNRKWIATADAGAYLVSADGSEIIEHFTTDNSPLPSNHVGSVVVSPIDNKVYFGTSLGLAEYSSTSSPAAESYSEVVAYPNPVRPEFSGWITVKGLMDNSYVKITDAAGNLVFATLSDGGMITWDGCNTNGHQVPTGVYYVFASQKEGGSGSAVTKIMIVR